MSEILNERNAIITAAATKMAELGAEVAQGLVEGKETPDAYTEGKKILTLLQAFTKEAELDDAEVEALLYCLRKLSGDSDFPTVEPLVGKGITYVVGQAGGTSGITLTPGANTVIWSAGDEWEVITLQELWNKLMEL